MDTEAIAGDDGGSSGPRSIGAVLSTARAARGVDLADIARETRVPLRHLAAIEADQHDSLPALPYAIGFVKAFARAVGVDAEMAGARFRAETDKVAHVPVAPAMVPVDERRLPPRGLVAASLAALLAIVAGVVAWSAGAFDAAPPAAAVATSAVTTPPAAAAPPVVPSAPALPVPAGSTAAEDATTASAATTDASAAPTATPAALPTAPAAATGAPAAAMTTSSPVVITANEDAWIRITVFDPAAGKVVAVKTGVLAKGERFVPPATTGLRLWTGRAGALAITVDGRPVPPLGGPVETVKNVSLDPGDLRARVAPPSIPAPGRAGPPVG